MQALWIRLVNCWTMCSGAGKYEVFAGSVGLAVHILFSLTNSTIEKRSSSNLGPILLGFLLAQSTKLRMLVEWVHIVANPICHWATVVSDILLRLLKHSQIRR